MSLFTRPLMLVYRITILGLLVHMMKYSDIFIRCQCYFVYGHTSEIISPELLISKLYTTGRRLRCGSQRCQYPTRINFGAPTWGGGVG